MASYEFEGFISFTFAIVLLFVGKLLTMRVELLRRCSIPEPVMGGFVAAGIVQPRHTSYGISRSRSTSRSGTGYCCIFLPPSA